MRIAVTSVFFAFLLAPGVLPPAPASGQSKARVSGGRNTYSVQTDALDLVRQGDASFRSGDFASAIKFWENARMLDPGLAQALNKNLGTAYAEYGAALWDDGRACAARDAFARSLALQRFQGDRETKIHLEAAEKDCRNSTKPVPAPVTIPARAAIPARIATPRQARPMVMLRGGPPAPAPFYTPQPAPSKASPFAIAQPQVPADHTADILKKKFLFMLLSAVPLTFIAFSRVFQGLSWNQTIAITSILLLVGWTLGPEFLAVISWLLAVPVALKHYWDKHFSRNRLILRPREYGLEPQTAPAVRPAPKPAPPAPRPVPAVIRLSPPEPSAPEQSRPTLRKVDALMEQGKYQKALEAFVVKSPGQLSEADRVNLFEIHLQLGNFDRAGGLFDQVKDVKPLKENISRYKSLAVLCYEKKQPELARKVSQGLFGALRETRPANEANAGFYYGFARSCEDNGDLALARDIYRHLMEAGLEAYKDVFARNENLKVRSAPPAAPAAQEPPARQPAKPPLPSFGNVLAGRYELKRGIGEGGMGVVYEGWDREISRKVAVKKMHSWLKSSPQEYERFKFEAKIVGRLRHPNIVGVHSIIEQDEEIYLVFDFVDGKTLAEMLRVKKRFPIDECRDIFSGVCAAVHYAHKNNVIHRDLKPANIMMDVSGYAFVMDFGLASELRESLSRVTHQTTSGTPAYMAPEQHAGIVKRESDIYAMGVCLYEMLTGELPFRGTDPLKLKRLKDYREVGAMLPWLPSGVDDLLSHALEPEPSQRIADALEFLEALKKL
ncbi:MAG: hypothetical protein A3J79_09155 [Elusimicrobia bacterium RIFOXYB2_FULL_62_6]|nr:MAG: hypothetical protein A3J79_09155 [Elusimicrobia bacterium RIFOXYB2_FULL_62_6]